jgi:hypothetical protein
MRKQRFKLPLAAIFTASIILLAIFLLLGYIWGVLTTSDFFEVKRIVVRNSGESFDYLKGRNIFTLDLDSQSQRALSKCASCRTVRFLKILPNCLVVDFLKRKPVAMAKFYKNYAVDWNGVFFSLDGSVQEAELPVICGLETKIFGPKPGIRYERPEIKLALDVIKYFKSNRTLRGFILKRIDVSSLQNASIFVLLPGQSVDYVKPIPQLGWVGFEVRVGEGGIKQKMMILGGLLMQAYKDLPDIKYIDLRFKEPVIKLKKDK